MVGICEYEIPHGKSVGLIVKIDWMCINYSFIHQIPVSFPCIVLSHLLIQTSRCLLPLPSVSTKK